MCRRRKSIELVTFAAACAFMHGMGATAQAAGKIEPKADRHLKEACTYLAGLKNFAFRVDETTDEIDDDGQKLQFSNRRHVVVSRPNRLAADASGDTANRKFYYDGQTVTLYDKTHHTYGTEKAADNIDATLDQVHEQFGYTPPLSDVLFADPYRVLTEKVESGTYVGRHSVGDVKCHHLAFRQKGIDWQIWITEGEKPLPRKLVITYKRELGEPQYSAVFAHWDVSPELTDATFAFKPPEGARKIDFVKVHEPVEKSSNK
jgi:hypothetical protein